MIYIILYLHTFTKLGLYIGPGVSFVCHVSLSLGDDYLIILGLGILSLTATSVGEQRAGPGDQSSRVARKGLGDLE